jgi:DNA-binding CsgD family transcriptional regulator
VNKESSKDKRSFLLAIVDSNILSCIGLCHILEKIIPNASVKMINSFEQLIESEPENFKHFFVSSSIYFEHASFFRSHFLRTIVMVSGDSSLSLPGALKLNICQNEKGLVSDLLKLQHHGHSDQPHKPRVEIPHINDFKCLSSRETEVLILLVKGYINKEIADMLSISLSTVISHRKNIMEKLGARSLSDVVIYAVMNGFVEVGKNPNK